MKQALIVIAVLLSIAFVTVLWWGVYPYKVMEITSPIEVWSADGKIYAGEKAFWKVSYNKTLPLEATIQAQIIDEFIVHYAPFQSNVPQGGDVLNSEFKIPDFMFGECYLYVTISYRPNPFRTVTYTFKSKPFTVLKKRCKTGGKND